MHALVYRTPIKLRRRKEVPEDMEGRVVEPNLEATGMELHKDSKWVEFKIAFPQKHKAQVLIHI